jgi:hypothetical protein
LAISGSKYKNKVSSESKMVSLTPYKKTYEISGSHGSEYEDDKPSGI